ncbi:MAG: AsmA family protein [Candidatus Latescibacterota bacterium]|nr:MAG: AsmA family protein [Candidatus Latescibacterota bacterium]
MRKLIVIGVVLIVIAAAVAILLFNLNGIVNKNKDFLIDRAESTIGRDIDIGAIGVTLRGGIGVRLQNVRLADDAAFSDEPFIEAADLQVNAKLLPLLRKQFEVKRVILREPVIRIIRNTDGAFNFLTFTGPGGTAQPAQPEGAGAIPLVVSLASIENGEIQFTDQKQKREIRVTNIKTSVKDLDFKKPISTQIEAAVLSDQRNVKIRATLGPAVEDEPEPLDIPGEVRVDIEGIDVARLFESFPELKTKLPPEFVTRGIATARLSAEGRLSNAAVEFAVDGTQLEFRSPKGFEKPAGIALDINGRANHTGEKIELSDTQLRFGSLQVGIHGEYRFGPPAAVDLKFDSKDIKLDDWNSVFPVLATYSPTGKADVVARIHGSLEPGRGPIVDGKATVKRAGASLPQYPKPITDIQADIAFERDKADIKSFSLRIGESAIEGNAAIENFEAPTVHYSVRSEAIAVTDIQPPKPDIEKPEILRNVTVQGLHRPGDGPAGQGRFASKNGSFANFDYHNLSTDYTITGSTITVSDIAVETLGGRLTGGGTITTGDQATGFDIHAKANAVDLIELIDVIPGSARKSLTGKANLDINISGSGKEWKDIKHTLSGEGLAELVNGEIVDWNIAKSFFGEIEQYAGSNVISQELKTRYPGVFQRAHTDFKNLKSDFVVEEGKILARNLHLNHAEYKIKGKGALGFERDLEFRATFIASKSLTDDLIKQYDAAKYLTNEQGQIEVPVLLSGVLPSVTARPDSDYLRNVMSKALVDEGLDILKKNNLQDLLPFGKKKEAKPDSTKKQ